MNRELREFRRLERLCLEQAALSTSDPARSGLLNVANDCRLVADSIEARSRPPSTFAGAVQALRLTLGAMRSSSRHHFGRRH